ncbi:hypothetical protein HER32_17530 [Hymenobacter sp. BT18]|uniref:AAA-like domain-containing protein n=1 Tax=Hymenobacter sp. BT18 TaxID=2835648 RepID=UPI00143E4B59|nr:AAA-like domain-containing protein [Hymenobacter sp. BT18]QIX62877.1 hypothetical protein HER32_17530 [Hymenobacter sp. BT18]
MHNKILKSYTIIPDHLYVRREADRLVEFIINDTGRPGYVLVARQMGKTNLLLNAKEQLIGPEDACVYVDFSNSFRSARECFRYIIDLAIDTNIEKLHFLSDTISKMRKESDEVDHVEHLLELRLLLQVIKGKLIILIDEVDAMTTVQFSDVIFKQIRSIYFSRTNYPILHKLNYILSGVGEPSKLIQDSKISPFNIGQEIFLGDFSYYEYLEFVRKAKLNLSNEVAERIYYWAYGNPRMTYEICSAVEDVLLLDSAIDVEIIDKIVGMMYLTTFDRVPLDNIRSMIQKDQDIARAVISLRNKDYQAIAMAQRRQLYLLGVVGANFENDKIAIKNRIIDKALSKEWLLEIVDDDNSLMELATLAFARKDYDGVISLLEESIDKYTGLDFVVLQHAIINSYSLKRNYRSVIDHFDKHGIEIAPDQIKDVLIVKLESLFLYASALTELSMFDKACYVYLKIISFEIRDFYYFKSLLAVTYLITKEESSLNLFNYSNFGLELEFIAIINKILTELEFSDPIMTEEQIKSIKVNSHVSLGMYYKDQDKIELAFNHFKEAFSRSASYIQPFVLFNMAVTAKSVVEKNGYLIESVNAVVNNKINLRACLNGDPIRFSYMMALSLVNQCLLFSREYSFILVRHFYEIETKLADIKIDKAKNIDLNQQLIAREEFILLSINEFSASLTKDQIRYSYKIFKESNYLTVLRGKEFFISATKDNFLSDMDSLDLSYFSVITHNAILEEDLELSQALVKFMRDNYFNRSGRSISEITLMDYYEMEIMRKKSNITEVFSKAKSILALLKGYNSDNSDSVFVDKKNIDNIRNTAFQTYTELVPKFSNAIDNSIGGRNRKVTVQFKDGSVATDKFKRFEKDIAKGLCKIL